MALSFRKEAVQYASQRLAGSVMLSSPLPMRLFTLVLAISVALMLFALSSIPIKDTVKIDGKVQRRSGQNGIDSVELYVPVENKARPLPGQKVDLTFSLLSGEQSTASGHVEPGTRQATSIPLRGYPVGLSSSGYRVYFVRLDSESRLNLYRAGAARISDAVLGEMEVGHQSLLQWLVNHA